MSEFQRRLEANIRESLRFAVGEVQDDAVAHMVAGVNAVLDHPSAPAPEKHVELFNPAEGSPATADQMAAVMLLHGTPEQQREALSPPPSQHLAVLRAELESAASLLETLAADLPEDDVSAIMMSVMAKRNRAALATTEGSTDG